MFEHQQDFHNLEPDLVCIETITISCATEVLLITYLKVGENNIEQTDQADS